MFSHLLLYFLYSAISVLYYIYYLTMADSGPLTKDEVAACLHQPGAGTKVTC